MRSWKPAEVMGKKQAAKAAAVKSKPSNKRKAEEKESDPATSSGVPSKAATSGFLSALGYKSQNSRARDQQQAQQLLQAGSVEIHCPLGTLNPKPLIPETLEH